MEIYRAVSEEEWIDIQRTRTFRLKIGQMEVKQFATNFQDALYFQAMLATLPPPSNSTIVKVKFPDGVIRLFQACRGSVDSRNCFTLREDYISLLNYLIATNNVKIIL